MLQETARVIEVSDGLLTIETKSRSGCTHCHNDSCTTSLVAKFFGVQRNRLQMANSIGAKPGDQVVIGIPDELLAQASLRVYLLPLLCMLGVTAIGDRLGMAAWYLGPLALCGLVLGFYFVHRISRGGSSHRFKPRLLRIVAPGAQQINISTLTRSQSNE